jgi:hypothetical protein
MNYSNVAELSPLGSQPYDTDINSLIGRIFAGFLKRP